MKSIGPRTSTVLHRAPVRLSVIMRSVLLAALVVLGGCYDQISVAANESNDRVDINNDEFELERRVEHPDEDVPIDADALLVAYGSSASGPAMVGPARAPSSISLRLITEALPPTIGTGLVQATSVWVVGGDKAIVSYNFQGGPAIGALDYFDKLNRVLPRLRSSASFLDSDVNAVVVDDNWAYAATLTSDNMLPSSAVVERIRFKGKKFTLEDNVRQPVASFAATSTVVVDDIVYATSGDDGAVYALDADDLSILAAFPLDDARWVAWDEDNDRIVVAQGTPGRLSVFEEGVFTGGTLQHLNTFTFPGADVPEAKTTVEVAGDLAIIAAGTAGVQIMCIDDGEILGSVPRPDPEALGLDPSVVVTNSVTVDDDLMFISNGEAGVYAAAAEDDFDDMRCDEVESPVLLGQLRFASLQSVNHIMYRSKELYVAAGLGGIKVVRVDVEK